ILRDQGQFEEAIEGYRRALERAPGMAMAKYGLGTALQGSGRFEDAVAIYQMLLRGTPDFALAHGNLGSALRALGRNDEAIASYREVLRLAPDQVEAHYDLGNLLKDLGRTREAAECYRQVLRLDPAHGRAHCQSGYLLLAEGRLDAALAANRRALEIEPRNVIAHNNMAEAFRDLGLLDDALACYRQALDIEPDNAVVRSNLLGTQNFIDRLGPQDLLADAVRFGELAARRARSFTSWPNAPDPARALRIGIVSGDLRSHPVGHFLEGALAALKAREPRLLEFHAYSNCDVHDAVSTRIAAACRTWCPAAGLSDEALARRIRSDGIDILLDLSGHTAFNRLTMFAWKPAPVQSAGWDISPPPASRQSIT
ncbi:MAG: tetratricopeptide repeat protein, partial [Betaproteobacteria bacterium]|nr:tetratricopeptide repeat protein [Betaproteobacteria bacterium]